MGEAAFVSLGSNIKPERNLPDAVRGLRPLGRILACSSVYQNPAVGPTPGPGFLNAAVLLQTEHSPDALRAELRALEARLGRQRTSDRFAPRTIDLDLVLYGAQVSRGAGLELPDPDLTVRPHLAIPLAELDPDHRHPITGESLRSIAARLQPQAVMHVHTEVTRQFRIAAGLAPDDEA